MNDPKSKSMLIRPKIDAESTPRNRLMWAIYLDQARGDSTKNGPISGVLGQVPANLANVRSKSGKVGNSGAITAMSVNSIMPRA